MKRFAGFAVYCLTAIAIALGVLALIYNEPGAREAIMVSAVVAFVVQMLAFVVVFAMAREKVMVGWGLGALMRLLALAIYALVAVPRLGFPLSAALVSMALFLFLSTLFEPFFLRP